MIWNSILIMTLLDLAIVAMAGAMLIVAKRAGLLGVGSPAVMCLVAGMLVVATFYLADLVTMHLGPTIFGSAVAMQLMEFLHLEAAWVVTLAFVGLLFCAFINFIRERRRSDRRISHLSDTMPVAICYVEPEERIGFANAMFAKWRQRPVEELLGRPVRELMSPEAYSTLAPYMKEVLDGHDVGFESVVALEYSPTRRDLQFRLTPDRGVHGEIRGFYALMTDVTEQKELEREVVAASERERNSIGRDLHDNLGQTLTGASLQLEALTRRLERKDSEDLQTVAEVKATIQRGIEETRNLARLLAPAFDRGGLERALESLAAESTQLFDIECTAECSAACSVLNAETSAHIYRIAQESVTNAARHGQPSTVQIKCLITEERLRIEILDDGTGIDPTFQSHGMGINTMRYRARMIGGDLRVEPRETGGTRVVCTCSISGLETVETPPVAAALDAERSKVSVDQWAGAEG